MKITAATLSWLAYWEYNIDYPTFEKKWLQFGGMNPKHFWNKFVGYNHSVIYLAGACDTKNLKILAKVVSSGYK
jgi:hypothetical protein